VIDYQISLGFYEGTIEPLHSLVRKSEIDIIDVPLAQILEGYFKWVENLTPVDLDSVGDFLVIAAHLLLTKVRTLLPLKQTEEEEEFGEDTSLETSLLSGTIQQYKAFRDFAEELGTREGEVLRRYSRPSSFLDFDDDDGGDAPLSELLRALKNVIDKASSPSSYEISPEEMDLESKIEEILAILRSRKKVLFEELFSDQTSRIEIIITFIAILELVRLQKALVKQTKVFDDIWVHARN
jgi:segregation and condensation protein A